jgi:hypothetical protein
MDMLPAFLFIFMILCTRSGSPMMALRSAGLAGAVSWKSFELSGRVCKFFLLAFPTLMEQIVTDPSVIGYNPIVRPAVVFAAAALHQAQGLPLDIKRDAIHRLVEADYFLEHQAFPDWKMF